MSPQEDHRLGGAIDDLLAAAFATQLAQVRIGSAFAALPHSKREGRCYCR